MLQSQPDALGTHVKLQNCANCTKYLTGLHCEISDCTDSTDSTDSTNSTDCMIVITEKV